MRRLSIFATANPVKRLWLGLSEPRFVTMIMFFSYVLVFSYGLYQITGLAVIHGELVNELTRYLVGSTFVLGGLVGMLASPKGMWQFERSAIGLVLTGLISHEVWIFYDPAPGVQWGPLFRTTMIISFLLIRWYTISWARMDPEK